MVEEEAVILLRFCRFDCFLLVVAVPVVVDDSTFIFAAGFKDFSFTVGLLFGLTLQIISSSKFDIVLVSSRSPACLHYGPLTKNDFLFQYSSWPFYWGFGLGLSKQLAKCQLMRMDTLIVYAPRC